MSTAIEDHRKEVLQRLTTESYRGVLDWRQTLTLVDACQTRDDRHRQHSEYRQQIQVADRGIANKADLYPPTEPVGAELEKLSAPESGCIHRQATSGGFHRCGWVFAAHTQFDFSALMSLLLGSNTLRLKAIMNSDKGWFVFNQVNGVLSTSELTEGLDSRLECINSIELDINRLERDLEGIRLR